MQYGCRFLLAYINQSESGWPKKCIEKIDTFYLHLHNCYDKFWSLLAKSNSIKKSSWQPELTKIVSKYSVKIHRIAHKYYSYRSEQIIWMSDNFCLWFAFVSNLDLFWRENRFVAEIWNYFLKGLQSKA